MVVVGVIVVVVWVTRGRYWHHVYMTIDESHPFSTAGTPICQVAASIKGPRIYQTFRKI